MVMLTPAEARAKVRYCVDDALSERQISEIPADDDKVSYAVWNDHNGNPIMVVAVWSYLNVRLDQDEAEDLATDLLDEKKWFMTHPYFPDYVL